MKLFSKSNATSIVWEYYGLYNKYSANEAVCRICGDVVALAEGSLSGLFRHLRFIHHQEYSKMSANRKILGKTYNQTNLKWIEMTNAISTCIIREEFSIETVEKQGFRDMLAVFDKKYVQPSRHYFLSKAIPAIFATQKSLMMSKVAQASFLSLSCERCQSESSLSTVYMSFTAHYIDSDWTLQSKKLHIESLPEDFSGAGMESTFQTMLANWNIHKKSIVSVTTDSGASMISACVLSGWPRVSCFGHNLNAAIFNALKDVRACHALWIARQIVVGFSYAEKTSQLSTAQQRLSLPAHPLLNDSRTRWVSVYLMMERLLEQKLAILDVLSECGDGYEASPSHEDFNAVASICQSLSPISELINALPVDKYVSLSSIYPVQRLLDKLMAIKQEDSDLSKTIKTKITAFLRKKFNSLPQNLLMKCAFLDPRFKEYVVSDTEAIKQSLCLEAAEILQDQPDLKKEKEELTLGHMLSLTEENRQESSSSTYELAVIEMNKYIKTPALETDADPLVWWKFKIDAGAFSIIPVLAKKYLCVCATSSTCERLFNTEAPKVDVSVLSPETKAKDTSISTKSKLPWRKTKIKSVLLSKNSTAQDSPAKTPSRSARSATPVTQKAFRPVKANSANPRLSLAASNAQAFTPLPSAGTAPNRVTSASRLPAVGKTNKPVRPPSTTPSQSSSTGRSRPQSASSTSSGGRMASLKNVPGKIGSLTNINHTPRGGKVKIDSKVSDYSAVTSKCGSKGNLNYTPGGGKVIIESKKLDFSNVTSKCGSKGNISHTPSGGKVKIETKKLNFSHVTSKCGSKENKGYVPGGGKVKIESKKLDFSNVASKCGSKDNINHTPSGGKAKVETKRLDFSHVKSKCGSRENLGYVPGGGKVKIEDRKIDLSKVSSKCGSMDNIKYEPQGGKVKIVSMPTNLADVSSRIGSKDNIHHTPGGGRVKILTKSVDLSHVTSKCGSMDNTRHTPGGGNVQIFDEKLSFENTAQEKVGSLDNNRREPDGGNEHIFDDKLLSGNSYHPTEVNSKDNLPSFPVIDQGSMNN